MIMNIALGGGATALTFLNKEALYNWFVWMFPGQLPADDILQAMNTQGLGNPIFDVQKDLDKAKENPLDTGKDVAGDQGLDVPATPTLPVVPTLPETPTQAKSDAWEYDF